MLRDGPCDSFSNTLVLCHVVRFFGGRATEAGHGGNGGAAGFGGLAGKVFIAGTDHPPPIFSIHRIPGEFHFIEDIFAKMVLLLHSTDLLNFEN